MTLLDVVILLGAAVVFAGVCLISGWIFVQAVKLLDRW